MDLSQDMQISLAVAANEAASRGNEYVGLEHMLFALLHDADTTEVITSCGGDVPQLRRSLETFLDRDVELHPEDRRRPPAPTVALQRVLSRAVSHVQSSGKEEVRGRDVLVAVFSEPESWAVRLLQEEGISRLDVVSYISHGVARRAALPVGKQPADAIVGDDDEADPLAAYCVNLDELAASGGIDPLVGRTDEVRRAIHVLARRRKNNPLFVGDSGVGKTAIVEGMALRIHEGDAPGPLRDAAIFSLDMGALLAGTRYRGDFERRMKAVLRALEERGDGSVLFIDELHTVIGAGAATGGTLDASNLLKPALAGGRLRCIGSTTYQDFRGTMERDPALMRRFQTIEVTEPSVEETVRILDGLKPRYEAFHRVRYSRAALQAAAELSGRYLQERRLPDKAIDVIDEAGAAARLSGREGGRVTRREVEAVLARMARIPPRRVNRSDRDQLARLEPELKAVVFGQDHAVEQLAAAIKVSRAGLGPPGRPVGSFLLTGPTGVGKTELSRQLAAVLGLEFLRLDMSEYMERHTVSRLIGAPPGYVGFDQGGLLTDAIRRTPHAVLLLDEIEKAHPDVFNLLLQVMDHGALTDNNGNQADFRHVILLMTSNVGSREMEQRPVGFGDRPADERGDPEYRRLFSPEFRNRLDARIRFRPLTPAVMERIVDRLFGELQAQLDGRRVRVTLTPAARGHLARRGHDPQLGARPMARLIQDEVRRPLSDELLFGKLQAGGAVTVDLDSAGDGLCFDWGTAPQPALDSPACPGR
jgi:ATP-dependent Clp protease ATP-binding subunit ClpA